MKGSKLSFTIFNIQELLDILSIYVFREMPCPASNLKYIVADVAKFKFVIKPTISVSMMHSGLIPKHGLWSQMSILDLHDIKLFKLIHQLGFCQ